MTLMTRVDNPSTIQAMRAGANVVVAASRTDRYNLVALDVLVAYFAQENANSGRRCRPRRRHEDRRQGPYPGQGRSLSVRRRAGALPCALEQRLPVLKRSAILEASNVSETRLSTVAATTPRSGGASDRPPFGAKDDIRRERKAPGPQHSRPRPHRRRPQAMGHRHRLRRADRHIFATLRPDDVSDAPERGQHPQQQLEPRSVRRRRDARARDRRIRPLLSVRSPTSSRSSSAFSSRLSAGPPASASPVRCAVGLAFGAAIGAINGLFVAKAFVPSFVTTLAVGSIAAGLELATQAWIGGGQKQISQIVLPADRAGARLGDRLRRRRSNGPSSCPSARRRGLAPHCGARRPAGRPMRSAAIRWPPISPALRSPRCASPLSR